MFINKNLKSVTLNEAISANELVEIISNHASPLNLDAKGNEVLSSFSPFVFNSASTLLTKVVQLNTSKVLVAYCDFGNSGYGTAIVLEITGLIITAGTEFVFKASNCDVISACALDSTRVCVVYGNGSTPGSIILSINNLTITAGSELVFNSGTAYDISTVFLTSKHVVICYTDTGNLSYGTAIVFSIDNLTITAGSKFVYNSGSTSYSSSVSIGSTRVLVSYSDVGNSSFGTAIILSINNLTITAGSEFVFNSGVTNFISASKLDDTRACVAYQDNGNSSYGTAIILSINNLTITAGSPLVFFISFTDYISSVTVSNTSVIVTYKNASGAFYGAAKILSINNLSITCSSFTSSNALIFNPKNTIHMNIILFNNLLLIVYTNAGSSNYGTAQLLKLNKVIPKNLYGITTIGGVLNDDVPVYIL